jgi:hypothetical protein
MKFKQIQKSIDIRASKEKVWQILTDQKYLLQWYAAFSAGSRAETDWQTGSKAIFQDDSNCGLVAHIVENKYAEKLIIEYDGEMINGKEVYDSPAAQAVKGGLECYYLRPDGDITHLAITCDMGEEYFQMMSDAWEKALDKIKKMSEANDLVNV